ncbi:unnamed protein product, partial [Symbiodinium sp. CCMP2592]
VLALQQLHALASVAEDPAAQPDSGTSEIWQGRPSKTSWTTWFQKVCSAVGPDFDGRRLKSREALEHWKKLSDAEQAAWKDKYHGHAQTLARPAVPPPKHEEQEQEVSTPQKKKQKLQTSPQSTEKCSKTGPQSTEKRLEPQLLESAKPRFDSRVETVAQFKKRWTFLKPELKKATSAAFLRNARDLHLLYLDVVHLLALGNWNGEVAKAVEALQDWRVNRKKIRRMQTFCNELPESEDPNMLPPDFCVGRHGDGLLNNQQKSDLVRHVTLCALSNQPLSVGDIKKAMFKFYLVNRNIVDASSAAVTPWEDYKLYERSMEHVYRRWKDWVAQSYPNEFHVRRCCLHARPAEQAAALTPKAVHGYFDTLERVLDETNLRKDGVLTSQSSKCIWVTDEKGMESLDHGKVKGQKVLAPRCVGSATCSVTEGSFGHISVLPFLSLGGHCSPPSVVVSGTVYSKQWETVWPEAAIRATPKGAMTGELFVQYTIRWANWVRAELEVEETQPLVLLLDTGGGSLIHLTPGFTIACEAKNIRPVFFPPYATAAVCPADQDPNAQAELRWDALRKTQQGISQLQALDLAHEVWDFAYGNSTHVRNGFKRCGLVAEQPIDRSKVFVDRGAQLFRSIVPFQEMQPTTAEGKAILNRPTGYKRAEQRTPCASCGRRTPTSLPKCGYCGVANKEYSEVADAVARGVAAVEAGTKANLAKWSGDLRQEMRRRKAVEPTGEEAAAKQAKSPSKLFIWCFELVSTKQPTLRLPLVVLQMCQSMLPQAVRPFQFNQCLLTQLLAPSLQSRNRPKNTTSTRPVAVHLTSVPISPRAGNPKSVLLLTSLCKAS